MSQAPSKSHPPQQKDGQLLPGKRGIALAADQVLALLTAAPQLTAGLERRDDSCRAQLSARWVGIGVGRETGSWCGMGIQIQLETVL